MLNYDSYRLDIIGDYRHSTITGWMRGLVRQVGTVAGIILGIIVCRVFGAEIADYFVSRGADHASIARACVYAVLFVIVF